MRRTEMKEMKEMKMRKMTTKPSSSFVRRHVNLCLLGVAVIVALVAWFVDVLAPIDPEPTTGVAPDYSFQVNQDLLGVKHLFENQFLAPEHVAVSREGEMYVSLGDGRIVIVDGEGETWKPFVRTGTFIETCGEIDSEPICGRPLGMTFVTNKHFEKYLEKESTDLTQESLLVADAYFGLLLVTKTGKVIRITNSVNGKTMMLPNSVVISNEGMVYFTDSSQRFHRNRVLYDGLERKSTGRLLRFDPIRHEMTVLLENLSFANGIALTEDEDAVIFAETFKYCLSKYFIDGPNKGRKETFADLPGLPDNLFFGYVQVWDRRVLLVGAASPRSVLTNLLDKFPIVRKILSTLPYEWIIKAFVPYGMIMVVSTEGEMLRAFQDPTGRTSFISGAYISQDNLYIGSWLSSYFGKIPLRELPALPSSSSVGK